MRYAIMLLILSACTITTGNAPKAYVPSGYFMNPLPGVSAQTYSNGFMPVCHGQMLGGGCTGPVF